MKMAYFRLEFILSIVLIFTNINSSKSEETPKPKPKLNIVTTTNIIADSVKNIAKDKVNLTSLMQAGVDPHLYRASFSDSQKLQDADIIFYNGLHLEGKMVEALESLATKKRVFAVSKDIPKDKLNKLDNSDNFDPHIWFDVSIWKLAVKCIYEVLSKEDPDNTVFYTENYTKYVQELDALDTYIKTTIAKIPEDRRILITAHDAFHYFGKAYNIKVDALQGVSTASEYGLRDVTRIVELITSKGIKSIFLESTIPERFILSVKEGVISSGKNVEIGGTLYSDSLGNADSPTGTYLGMVKYNVDTIFKALN